MLFVARVDGHSDRGLGGCREVARLPRLRVEGRPVCRAVQLGHDDGHARGHRVQGRHQRAPVQRPPDRHRHVSPPPGFDERLLNVYRAGLRLRSRHGPSHDGLSGGFENGHGRRRVGRGRVSRPAGDRRDARRNQAYRCPRNRALQVRLELAVFHHCHARGRHRNTQHGPLPAREVPWRQDMGGPSGESDLRGVVGAAAFVHQTRTAGVVQRCGP